MHIDILIVLLLYILQEIVGDDPVCIHQIDSASSFVKGTLDIPWFIVLGTLIASSHDIMRKVSDETTHVPISSGNYVIGRELPL